MEGVGVGGVRWVPDYIKNRRKTMSRITPWKWAFVDALELATEVSRPSWNNLSEIHKHCTKLVTGFHPDYTLNVFCFVFVFLSKTYMFFTWEQFRVKGRRLSLTGAATTTRVLANLNILQQLPIGCFMSSLMTCSKNKTLDPLFFKKPEKRGFVDFSASIIALWAC